MVLIVPVCASPMYRNCYRAIQDTATVDGRAAIQHIYLVLFL